LSVEWAGRSVNLTDRAECVVVVAGLAAPATFDQSGRRSPQSARRNGGPVGPPPADADYVFMADPEGSRFWVIDAGGWV